MNSAVKACVGLYLSDKALTAVRISRLEKRYQIEQLETTPLYGGKIDWLSASSLETFNHTIQRLLLKFQPPFDVVVLLDRDTAIKRSVSVDTNVDTELLFQDLVRDNYISDAPEYDGLLSSQRDTLKQTAILAKRDGVTQWRRVLSAAGFSLFGFDSMPLSIARVGRLFVDESIQDYVLLSVDDLMLDVSVIQAGKVLFSYTLREDVSVLLRSDTGRVFLQNRWQEIVDSLGDSCPKNGVYVQSNLGLNPVFSTVSENGPSFEWTHIDWQSQFGFASSINTEVIKKEDLTLFFWPLITSLAVHDAFSQPLLFHRRAERINSSVKPLRLDAFKTVWVQFLMAGIIVFFLVLSVGGMIGYLDSKIESIVIEKQKIEQSPVYQDLKQRADLSQVYVAQLSRLRDRTYSSVNLVNTLVSELPEDMVFEAVNRKRSGEISLSLKSFSHSSIYTYFSFIESQWGRAKLSEIKRIEDEYLNEMYTFEISFVREVEGEE